MPQTTTGVTDDQATLGDDKTRKVVEPQVAPGPGEKEREPFTLSQAKEASLESAAKEAEKIKAELAEHVPEHDKHLVSDDLASIGASVPLKEAEEVVESQTVSIPISQFELENKKGGSLEESVRWMKTKCLWIAKKAAHLGRRVIFGKTSE